MQTAMLRYNVSRVWEYEETEHAAELLDTIIAHDDARGWLHRLDGQVLAAQVNLPRGRLARVPLRSALAWSAALVKVIDSVGEDVLRHMLRLLAKVRPVVSLRACCVGRAALTLAGACGCAACGSCKSTRSAHDSHVLEALWWLAASQALGKRVARPEGKWRRLRRSGPLPVQVLCQAHKRRTEVDCDVYEARGRCAQQLGTIMQLPFCCAQA